MNVIFFPSQAQTWDHTPWLLHKVPDRPPADQSALTAIREVTPQVPYSCQQGFCGTCRVNILDGTVQRRGTAQFLDTPDTMLICVDRSNDPTLTIDL